MLFGVATVNEVWGSIVNAIIMAFVTQALPIVYIVSECRKVFDGLDVVSFQIVMATTILTGELVFFKNCFSPGQIFYATTTLCLAIIFAKTYARAISTTVHILVALASLLINSFGYWATKLFSTDETFAGFSIGKRPTFSAAIHRTTNVRRWTSEHFAAVLTGNYSLLRAAHARTFTRAVSFLGILVPISIRFFFDGLSANLALFQSFRMRGWLFSDNANVRAFL
jgi:hypothetical protein